MALFDIKLFSTELLTNTDIRVVIPTPDEPFYPDKTPYYQEGKKYQTLYLLHGGFGDCSVWTRNTSIERYAQKHKLAVVMASVTNSCYLNMAHGPRFMSFMSEELPRFVNAMFPLSTRREDTFIAGMSMGGYGAYRVALQTPERFSCAASLSGALDIASTMKGVTGVKNPMNPADIFGDPDAIEGSENDLMARIAKLKAEGIPLPRFYQCCGTEDFIYPSNVTAHQKLVDLGADLTYTEGPGQHNWDYWDVEIQKVLAWLPLAHTLVD